MFRSLQRRIKSSNDSLESNKSDASAPTQPRARITLTPSKPSSSNSNGRSTNNRRPKSMDVNVKELTSKVPHLLTFEACVEAADVLASSSGDNGPITELSSRVDARTGLQDCSVLVSSDGILLLMPKGGNHPFLYNAKSRKNGDPHKAVSLADSDDSVPEEKAEGDSEDGMFSELMHNSRDDYASAIFVGNDLDPTGDRALNGFSAKGWSLPATSYAMQQTHASLGNFKEFCETLILDKKESAARASQACDALRARNPGMGGTAPTGGLGIQHDWEMIDPKAVDFVPISGQRTGPFMAQHSTLNKAVMALEQYFASVAEDEGNLWRQASLHRTSVIPTMTKTTDDFDRRSTQREEALVESSRRARIMEERLNYLQREADRKWEQVYKGEDKVAKKEESMRKERSRQREKQRLAQLRHEEQKQAKEAPDGSLGATSAEIWSMVNAVSRSMEDGSFEPMAALPEPAALPDTTDERTLQRAVSSESMGPLIDRDALESEFKLPELRQAAMAADDALEDAAGAFLNVLSNMDTTRRSSRIAAEAALVSAGNGQASCIQAFIKLERSSLEAKLKHLEELEARLEDVDIRADLDAYIVADKKERGGTSHLGDDDDGGVASALAVLSSHVDGGYAGTNGRTSRNNSEDLDDCDDDSSVTRETLHAALEGLFANNEVSLSDKITDNLNKSVELLCTTTSEKSSSARARRATICYALNTKRSQTVEIPSETQFEGLCRLFSSMLTSCADNEGGVSNIKMLMMLAQTFYITRNKSDTNDLSNVSASPARARRSRRLYVRSRLIDHPIWAKDDFWDEALSQQISESLTQSGVMSNFERGSSASRTPSEGDYRKTRRIKWYDLSFEERMSAASQVHAVVFAQLGALAHSMIEFGCGLERSCAFVRRMAVRNQLPTAQRTMLLQHLMARDDVDRKETTQTKDSK